MHKAHQMNTLDKASPGLLHLDPGKAAPAAAVLGGETVFTILHHFSLFKIDFQPGLAVVLACAGLKGYHSGK